MSGGSKLAGGHTVALCDMIDLDCHSAQLGVIAWRQIKDYIVPRWCRLAVSAIVRPTSKDEGGTLAFLIRAPSTGLLL